MAETLLRLLWVTGNRCAERCGLQKFYALPYAAMRLILLHAGMQAWETVTKPGPKVGHFPATWAH